MTDTIIDRFFQALASQNLNAALELVTTDAIFEAQGPASVPIYGRYNGHDGVCQFLSILGDLFETEKFEIRESIENSTSAFAFGYMQHRVRKTDRVFRSEFSLYCQVREGRIAAYKMFEDTAALENAYNGDRSAAQQK